jgi:Holliday junction resolvase
MARRSRRRWSGGRAPRGAAYGAETQNGDSAIPGDSPGDRGRRFEVEVSQKLHSFGWDVSLTAASGDFGCDVVARCGSSLLVVQCKQWAQGIGLDAVQEIHTAKALLNANEAAVIVRGRFTVAARQAASKLQIHLLHIDDLRPGHAFDRSVEGQRVRSRRAAEAAEQQRQQQEAARRKQVEAQLAAWSAFDLQMSKVERRRRLKEFFPFGLLVVGGGWSWLVISLFATHPLSALFLAGCGIVALWKAARAIYGFRPPSPPSFSRPQSAPSERRVVNCLHCGTAMRLPADRSGSVACPQCKRSAWYET